MASMVGPSASPWCPGGGWQELLEVADECPNQLGRLSLAPFVAHGAGEVLGASLTEKDAPASTLDELADDARLEVVDGRQQHPVGESRDSLLRLSHQRR